MGMAKNYFHEIICACAEGNAFAQDAVDHAITTGQVTLTMDRQADERAVMSHYDEIVANYRQQLNQQRKGKRK